MDEIDVAPGGPEELTRQHPGLQRELEQHPVRGAGAPRRERREGAGSSSFCEVRSSCRRLRGRSPFGLG
jgi:hypothetical protein